MTQRRSRWRWILGLLVALAVGRGISGLVAGAAQAEALGVRPSWRLFTAMDLSLRTLVAAVAALVLFVCPSCGHVATVRDWRDAGAPESAVAFSCVGRWKGASGEATFLKGKKTGPCNYAGGGLFRLNPVYVGAHQVFDFAPLEAVAA